MPSRTPTISSKDAFLRTVDGSPLALRMPARGHDPLSLLQRGWTMAPRFLLESSLAGGGLGRYSFMGGDPYLLLESKGGTARLTPGAHGRMPIDLSSDPGLSPPTILRDLLRREAVPSDSHLPPFQGGAVGCFGYDWVRHWERLPHKAIDDLCLPDLNLLFVDLVAAVDHADDSLWLMFNPGGYRFKTEGRQALYEEGEQRLAHLAERLETVSAATSPSLALARLHPYQSAGDYIQRVKACQEYIAAGDVFQVNLSHRFTAFFPHGSPLELYRRLRAVSPTPFAVLLDLGERALVGASPERLIKRMGDQVETRPVAGTRQRGSDPEETRRLGEELLTHSKERAEHIMLVDLERNDLGKLCRYGSIKVDEWMRIETYSHVQHIVSNIRGTMLPEKDPLDLIEAVFPGGTVTGVPKIRCMEIIDELEPVTRGPYTGAVGYISHGGEVDLSITIRTLVVDREDVHLHVGAGIVADSHPAREYEETLFKAAAAVQALGGSAEPRQA